MSKKNILKKRGFMIEIWILMKIEYFMDNQNEVNENKNISLKPIFLIRNG